ncbi:MAG TPA: branched-chain amino acid ABC transporter ATP-binding protein/permease [Candidatus Methylomirabilis sp.]|nr:branched-chain amino acid ABC transporter ATP-binding protein/permease [Candidatus Methylomirabilis sp.]
MPSGPRLAIAAAVLALLPLVLPPFFLQLLTEIAIIGLFATAFNLLMGFGGMVSFGHAAYFALGAYTAALLAKRADVPMVLALLLAPLVAAVGALLFGFFIVRLTHTYFAMLSLAFGQIVFTVIFKWKSLTGGDDGLLDVWPPAFLKSAVAYYYFAVAVVVLCLWALYAIVESPFGYALRAVRDNPRRARFIGINVRRHQLVAFVISGAFSGMAGGLFAFYNGSVFPDFAYFTKSFEPLVVALLGGVQSFYGPLAGAFGFKILEWLISRQWPVYWPLFLGTVVILVIVALPQGFIGLLSGRPGAAIRAHLRRWRPRTHAQRTGSTPRVRPSGAALQMDPSHRSWPAASDGHSGSTSGSSRSTIARVATGPADGRSSLILQALGLKKHFGGVQAVNGVNLAVAPGDLRAIIGPNGAGKTTLFNLLSGDLRHDTGQIRFMDVVVSGLRPHELCRRGLSRTFQITSIFRRLTVIDNVRTALLTHRRRHYNVLVPARRVYQDEALGLLERVGLRDEAGKPSGILAHGDQRRLELAIALASEPQLLLLDEPTAGMAPRERHEIMAMVAGIARDTGLTIVFTEHDMDVVFAVATRITVLHQGSVIAEGTPAEVRANAEVQRVYLGQPLALVR